MRIDLKNPRYVLPIVVLPFLLLLFYAYKSSNFSPGKANQQVDSLQSGLADVSAEVQSRKIAGKLDAFRERFRQADGYTAVNGLDPDQPVTEPLAPSQYNEKEKRLLDSLAKGIREQSRIQSTRLAPNVSKEFTATRFSKSAVADKADEALKKALSEVNAQRGALKTSTAPDPMQLFRAQMSLIDSMSKANDPAQKQQGPARKALESGTVVEKVLPVYKSSFNRTAFNTVRSEERSPLIAAILDEEATVFSGSRLRIRLLEEVMAGPYMLPKDTYLYAQVSGFAAQRVLLTVTSAFIGGEVLPLKLEVCDNDGIPGIFVPASAFREFSKDLSAATSSAGTSAQLQVDNRMVMSMVSGIFQSANTALNKLIRRNHARLKYDTRVYLVDSENLKNRQNNNKRL